MATIRFFFFLGSPLQNLVGWVTAPRSQPSEGGACPRQEEPAVARAARSGGGEVGEGTGGVEGFGGGEGKAHLLYSWPLCVKQALWAATELGSTASKRPL